MEKRIEKAMTIIQRVEKLFDSDKFCCAETSLYLLAQEGGRDPRQFVGLATGFCAGMSRNKEQCGAVSGAVMGLGLFCGRYGEGEEHSLIMALTGELMERFAARYSSINCWELTGCDFATEAGQKKFREENVLEKCHGCTAFCVETAISLLQEKNLLSI